MGKLLRSRLVQVGLATLVLGTGPLFAVMVLASLGLTRDPNPNPVGLGILAMLTFWPSVILIAIGAVRAQRRADQTLPPVVRPRR